MYDPVSLVLIGCGKISNGVHIPALIKLRNEGKINILGTCDIDLEASSLASKKFDINNFTDDWKTLVDQVSPDAVSICLPPKISAKVSEQAILRGLHVISEKPPGINLKQSLMIKRASERYNQNTHMIGFNRRYAPILKKLVKKSNKLGKPNTFYGTFNRPSIGEVPSNNVDNWIISDSIHIIDMSISLMGFPKKIIINKRILGNQYPNVWSMQFFHDRGSSLINLNYASGKRYERFEWAGNGYSSIAELPLRGFWYQAGDQEEIFHSEYENDLFMSYGFYNEYKHFIESIINKKNNIETDFKYGNKLMVLIDNILKSNNGELIKIDYNDSQPEIIKKKNFKIENKLNILFLNDRNHVSRFYKDNELNVFEENYNVKYYSDKKIKLKNIDIVIAGHQSVGLNENDIINADNLKIVIVLGSSVKFVSPLFLISKDILLYNTAKALAVSVAEHCLLATICGLRNIINYDKNLRLGRWNSFTKKKQLSFDIITLIRKIYIPNGIKRVFRPLYTNQVDKIIIKKNKSTILGNNKFHDLNGKTVGLIGWGHISKEFVKLLKPFNCKILITSNNINDKDIKLYNLVKVGLGELLSTSKIISIHKGSSPSSYHYIGEKELNMVKSGSVLINSSRGDIINQNALIKRLEIGDIVAFLDVFESEPVISDNPLNKLDNVILTPHIACDSIETDFRIGKEVEEIIKNWENGSPIESLDASYISNMT